MKSKKIKKILIITICLLLPYKLIDLFRMPWYGPYLEINSVKNAKKKNIFIGDYKADIVEVFDSTYQLPNFKNIILTGTLIYERNKFGIASYRLNTRNRKR